MPHPHMRGEYEIMGHTSKSMIRFIPTCVGNTFWRDGRIIESAVHPHVRGEYPQC